MRYLIDTYNVIHSAAAGGGPDADFTVRKLCQYLAASASSVKATLILDGRAKPDEPSENEFPDIHLVYSGTGVKADAVIAQMVERSLTRKKLTIVSDDREVILHARRHFANVKGCEQFLRELTQGVPRVSGEQFPAKKTAGTPTSGEADHWMKEFGFHPPSNLPQRPATGGNVKKDEDVLGGLNVEDLLGPAPPADAPRE